MHSQTQTCTCQLYVYIPKDSLRVIAAGGVMQVSLSFNADACTLMGIFLSGQMFKSHTGVCEINTPFAQALALQSNSRNCSPAPDLVFSKLIISRVFFFGGVNVHRYLLAARHSYLATCSRCVAQSYQSLAASLLVLVRWCLCLYCLCVLLWLLFVLLVLVRCLTACKTVRLTCLRKHTRTCKMSDCM